MDYDDGSCHISPNQNYVFCFNIVTGRAAYNISNKKSEVFAKLSSNRQFNLNELAFILIPPATHLAIIQVDKGCLKAKLVKQQELKET